MSTKSIEAHFNKSHRCPKACAGVASVKGLGAEEREGRTPVSGIAENIRRVVAEMRRAIFIPVPNHRLPMDTNGQRTLFDACLCLFDESAETKKKEL